MGKSQGNTVLIAGSANLDFVVRASHVPAPGETVLGRDFATFPGGKGANQAVACSRAGGATTRMLLALGEDDAGRVLEASLREAGVQPHIVRSQHPSGVAFICLSDDAENAITVAPGANLQLQASDLPSLEGVALLLMQLETPLPAVLAYARAARAVGVKVVLNAAPAQALPVELLQLLDLLIVNEGELAMISGIEADIGAALRSLQVPDVVVTLGARGSCARRASGFVLQPAYPVQAVDTTGAGDTFCGTLVAALAEGLALDDGLQLASAASAIACTRLGAQTSIPQQAELAPWLAAQPLPSAAQRAALAHYCGLPDGT